MSRIAVIDYGLGNLFSVLRALDHLGADPHLTSDPIDLADSDGLILPGVGAFGEGITNLRSMNLADEIQRLAAAGKPILGICLGMQLLMDSSEELGDWEGLGLIPGRVIRLGVDHGVKIPQIGWNAVDTSEAGTSLWSKTILDGVDAGTAFYFVHSYCVQTAEEGDSLAVTEYGSMRFCSVAVRGNVAGCQFHPEKSGTAGLRVLRNFVSAVNASGAPGDA